MLNREWTQCPTSLLHDEESQIAFSLHRAKAADSGTDLDLTNRPAWLEASLVALHEAVRDRRHREARNQDKEAPVRRRRR